MTELNIPELSLVALVGASGSGKTTFGREHFGPYEVISSDFCRGLVADDENDNGATRDAFDVLHYIAGKRLDAGRLTVVDATNVQREARRSLVQLAREHDVLPVAIVLDLPEKVCVERTLARPDRDFGARVVRRQRDQLRRSLRGLAKEGFRKVHVLSSVEEVAAATVVREKLLSDYRDQHGPFDVVGDVHGCRSELEALLSTLGYELVRGEQGRPVDAVPPRQAARRLRRRPRRPRTRLPRRAAPGDGDGRRRPRAVRAGQPRAQAGACPRRQRRADRPRSRGDPRPAVAGERGVPPPGRGLLLRPGLPHRARRRPAGGGPRRAQGGLPRARVRTRAQLRPVRRHHRRDRRVRPAGALPVGQRLPRAGDGPLRAHPTPETEWVNNTMCLDTGCVFGGRLTALRYPEKDVVSVPAERVWYEPAKPFPVAPGPAATGERDPGQLDLDDVLGKRIVETAHHGRVTVREENAAGALEVMSRFALHPRWVPYLPPTMAPVATSARPDLLEHPDEAFATYAAAGVERVICEEKHMGSRAVLLVCRDGQVARERFGATGGETGAVYTRTGRSFYSPALTTALLERVAAAVSGLEAAGARGIDVADLLDRTRARAANAEAFTAAYRRYCWPVDGLSGVSLAPFQVLASEGSTYHDRDHGWHLAIADRLVAAEPTLFRTTRRLEVEPGDPESVAAGVAWWEALTAAGGEGMVVKPFGNLTRAGRGLAQPGLKVRGREYLRLIYGPDYTEPEHLERLRDRKLEHKRSLALREYALGLEALERLTRGEPLWRVHEAVFAVLALESEPVDPRL